MTMYIVRLAILAIAYSRKSAPVQAAVHHLQPEHVVPLIKLIFNKLISEELLNFWGKCKANAKVLQVSHLVLPYSLCYQ